jgi:putative FmdB family regulatory protein
MPLYEYRCGKCHAIMEVIQSFTDPAPKKCAACGAAKPRKVISRSGFVLKGSGWYQSDYKPAPSSKSDEKAGDEKAADAKPADAKPADPKADSKADAAKPADSAPSPKDAGTPARGKARKSPPR